MNLDEARELLELAKRNKVPSNPCVPAPIGSGPAGETCGTCRHKTYKRLAKAYMKCGLMQAHWTGGAGSDIKARWPACAQWSGKP